MALLIFIARREIVIILAKTVKLRRFHGVLTAILAFLRSSMAFQRRSSWRLPALSRRFHCVHRVVSLTELCLHFEVVEITGRVLSSCFDSGVDESSSERLLRVTINKDLSWSTLTKSVIQCNTFMYLLPIIKVVHSFQK